MTTPRPRSEIIPWPRPRPNRKAIPRPPVNNPPRSDTEMNIFISVSDRGGLLTGGRGIAFRFGRGRGQGMISDRGRGVVILTETEQFRRFLRRFFQLFPSNFRTFFENILHFKPVPPDVFFSEPQIN